MTGWHLILIGGAGVVVLAVMLVQHFVWRRTPTHHIEDAPEEEADRRFTTTVRRGDTFFSL
jgi:hypothetical protein